MQEINRKIIIRLPKLEFNKWYTVSNDEVLEALKDLMDIQTLKTVDYLELSNDYQNFRKLKIQAI